MKPLVTALFILSLAGAAAAQESTQTIAPTSEAAPFGEPAPSGEGEPSKTESALPESEGTHDASAEVPPSREQAVQSAMAKYEVGEFEEALAGLRAAVHQCTSEEGACASNELAAYYAKLAVVLSSASSNPQTAVVVWRKALALDPEVELAPEHRTPMAARAYREAKQGDEVATESEAAQPPVGRAGAEPNAVPQRRRIFLLSTGSLKGGLIASDLLAMEVGEGEGAVALGGRPLQKGAFALGFRARGGGQFPKQGLGGYWGAGFLAGAILGERRSRSFSYVMGGAGVKHFVGADVVHPAAQIMGGRSFGGLLVGGVVDYSYGWVGQRVSGGLGGFSSLPINGHIIQLGIEVGSGQLL